MRRYILLLTTLLFFLTTLSAETKLFKTTPPPRHVVRTQGSLNLAGGIYFTTDNENRATESLIGFFRQNDIPVTRLNPSRRDIPVHMSFSKSIEGVPAGAKGGYHISVSRERINIVSDSPHSTAIAVRIIKELYQKSSGVKKSRKKLLMCYEITGWDNEKSESKYRMENNPFIPAAKLIKNTEQYIPHGTSEVELVLTDPVAGWFIAGDVLKLVNEKRSIHPAAYYSYEELNNIGKRLNELEITVIPTIDLSTPNLRFRDITGHPMLSVEGFRFVKALLDEFFRNTGYDTVNIIIPEGKYRNLLDDFTKEYPQITQVNFLDK